MKTPTKIEIIFINNQLHRPLIPTIKLIRRLTNLDLKEAKCFVEEHMDISKHEFSLIITHEQLGRFFERNFNYPSDDFLIKSISIIKPDESIDLTRVEE